MKNKKNLFVLQHINLFSDIRCDIKLIGVYSSLARAEDVIEKYKMIEGFKEHTDGFQIFKYTVDNAVWKNGFNEHDETMIHAIIDNNPEVTENIDERKN